MGFNKKFRESVYFENGKLFIKVKPSGSSVMALKRKAYSILGVLQTLVGVSTILLSYSLYFNLLNIRSLLNLSEESITFYFVILTFIGLIMIANAVFLILQWLKYKI